MAQTTENLPANQENSSILGSGRSPGEGNSYPLQYSCLKNSMDRGSWVGYSPWGHKELDTTEWLTLSLYIYLFSFTGELLAEGANLVVILEDKEGRIEPKPDFQSFSDKLHQSFPTWEVTCWRLGFSQGWGIYGFLNFLDGKWKKKCWKRFLKSRTDNFLLPLKFSEKLLKPRAKRWVGVRRWFP